MRRRDFFRLALPIMIVVPILLVVPVFSSCTTGNGGSMPSPSDAVTSPEPEPEPEPEPTEAEPITIGIPVSITGLAAADGIDVENGAIMAIEDLNARGGVLGRPVQYERADTGNWTAEEHTAARDFLMSRDVVGFFPGWSTNPAFMDVFSAEETGGIPYLHCGTTELFANMYAENTDKYWNVLMFDDTSRIYSPNAYVFYCRYVPTVYEYPKKTVAILTSEQSYSIDISAGLRRLIEGDPEWSVVVDEFHPFGALEFGTQLEKIRAADPGLVFFSTSNIPEAAAFQRQFMEDPTNSLVHHQYSPSSPEFRRLLGEKCLGVTWQTIIGVNPTHEARDWSERYWEEFDVGPGVCLSWWNYDMIMSWAKAVEVVGDEHNYEGICNYLINNEMNPDTGKYEITHMLPGDIHPLPSGFTFGPGGMNICPIHGTDRTNMEPAPETGYPERYYVAECHPGMAKGYEYGSSIQFYQIQWSEQDDYPVDILLTLSGMPTEEYMMEYYGYPPDEKYIDELGTEFQVPSWIEQ